MNKPTTITPTLYDVCPEYRKALDDCREASVAWVANPCEATGWAFANAWERATKAAHAFRKLKAVE